MRRLGVVLLIVSLASQSMSWAVCPSGDPHEIFCESFDTYCASGGGYPGSTACSPGAMPNDALLHDVWFQTSLDGAGATCGTASTLQTDTTYYVVSPPFGGKFPGAKTDVIAQHTFRDWVLSAGQPTPVLDMHRLMQNMFGPQYLAVAGLDEVPLVLSFEVNSEVEGKIFYSMGYIELAAGDPSSNLNRANTDYVLSPDCYTFCDPYIAQGPFPIACAVGNPENGQALPAACPATPAATAPLHNAIAVGVNASVDPNPCHCGSALTHGWTNWHPTFFDGKVWWNLRSNSPYASSGSVTPLNGAPATPPADIARAGRFSLYGSPTDGTRYYEKPHNWMTLTIKTNTVKIELTTIEESRITPGARYRVYSVMDNIPRKYLGAFDTMRIGGGPGCELADNSWNSCVAPRTCMVDTCNQARFVGFDDISLSYGTGWTPYGGCCLPNGSCQDDTLPETCQALGGIFQGAAKTCAMSICCPALYPDSDHDGDVDASDFGTLQRCYTGTQTVTGQCSCFDKDKNNKVDDVDVAAFISCAAGPSVAFTTVPATCTR